MEKTINERFRELRKACGKTQAEMGKVLGVTTSGVSDIESKRRNVTEQHIIMLSNWKGKNVNTEWLRTGQGEMFADIPQEDEYFKAATQISKNGDDLIMSMIVEYWKLDENSKETFRKYIRSVADSIKKEQD